MRWRTGASGLGLPYGVYWNTPLMAETSMRWLEALAATAADNWIELACALVAVAALALSVRVMRRAAGDRRRLDDMRRDLQAFTEASTRVADTLNHLLNGDVAPVEQSAPSRRYLLLRAREGLENGETVEDLASRLDLCEDERKLLEFLQGSGSAGVHARAPAGARAFGRERGSAKRAWVA